MLRTDTTIAPITVRGIDWEHLQRLKSLGARAMEPSVLRTEAEVQKVLAHPLLVVRGDAAGIARATGIVTTTKRLQQLARRIAVETRARQLLSLHGERALQARVRGINTRPAHLRAELRWRDDRYRLIRHLLRCQLDCALQG